MKKKQQQVNDQEHKTNRVMIRLTDAQKSQLLRYADETRRTITSVIMELLEPIFKREKKRTDITTTDRRE